MDLDAPLGKWRQVPRNTWFEHYIAKDSLIVREDEKLHRFQHRGAGLYDQAEEIDGLPEESHPVSCQFLGKRYWCPKKMRLQITPPKEEVPPGYVLWDDLDEKARPINRTASDGSVYTYEQVASAAWMLTSGPDQQLMACYLLQGVNRVTSYRAELEGVYRALKQIEYKGLTPEQITQFCDNQRTVVRSMEGLYTPTEMIGPDADLVLAIQALKTKLDFPVECKHVYGHQDSRGHKQGQQEEGGDESDDTQTTRGK